MCDYLLLAPATHPLCYECVIPTKKDELPSESVLCSMLALYHTFRCKRFKYSVYPPVCVDQFD